MAEKFLCNFIVLTSVAGCVATTTPDLPVITPDIVGEISAPKVEASSTAVTFKAMVLNRSDKVVCFDGSADFPLGLQLNRASDGAWLAFLNGTGERDIGDSAAPRIVKMSIAPNETQAYEVILPAPIEGPYEIPFVSLRYQIGESLIARMATGFYDCSYATFELAEAAGRGQIVNSPPSQPFREQ